MPGDHEASQARPQEAKGKTAVTESARDVSRVVAVRGGRGRSDMKPSTKVEMRMCVKTKGSESGWAGARVSACETGSGVNVFESKKEWVRE